MKKSAFALLLFISSACIAQPVRLHIMGGFANYTGDIQQARFTLNQAKGVISAGGTYNISDKLAVRADYSFARLGADDKYNSKANFRARNLNFKTIIQEVTLMGEYNLFNMQDHPLSPYVFAGIGFFHFSPYTIDAAGDKVYLQGLSTEGEGFAFKRKVYNKTQPNIPIGGGLRYALSDDVFIGFEIGLRVLKTDYLDDVSATYIDKDLLLANRGQEAVDVAFRGDELKDGPKDYPAAGTVRGNAKVNDFYYFGQLRLSFRMNWFSDSFSGGGLKSGLKRLGCPTRF